MSEDNKNSLTSANSTDQKKPQFESPQEIDFIMQQTPNKADIFTESADRMHTRPGFPHESKMKQPNMGLRDKVDTSDPVTQPGPIKKFRQDK